MRKRILLVRLYFTSTTQYVLFDFLGWSVRWEVGDYTVILLLGYCSQDIFKTARILCSYHLGFLPGILLEYRWCIHTIVPTRQQLGKKLCFISSERWDFHMIDYLSISVHALSRRMIFVAASHQTGLDTRLEARRLIKVGIQERGKSGTSRDSNPAGLCCLSTH